MSIAAISDDGPASETITACRSCDWSLIITTPILIETRWAIPLQVKLMRLTDLINRVAIDRAS